jgi:hypothetical protein
MTESLTSNAPEAKSSAAAPQPTWPRETERQLWADFCRRSFWWFFKKAWGADLYMAAHPNDRWLTERLHRPICDWLQMHVEEWELWRSQGLKKRKKLALIIPRSFGKTVTATKALSLWAHVRNPDLASMIGSEVVTKANDFLQPIKTVMSGDDPYAWFTWLYGNWESEDRVWTQSRVVHAARRVVGRTEPSFSTWGIETGVTGLHPDWGILDDPLSEEKLKEAGTWLQTVNQSVAALRPAFRSDSFFMFSLTRYRDNDVAGTYLKLEGVRSWTGMKPREGMMDISPTGEWDVYFLQALDAQGESILPEVWPTEELRKYEETKPQEFAAQMMNEPGTGEHMALTAEQVDQLWIDQDKLPPGLTITIHCDTAFKDRSGQGDESVIEVWGHDPRGNGDVYFLEGYGSNKWRVEDFTDKLVSIVQTYRKKGKRVRCITDERGSGGKDGLWENHMRSSFAAVQLPCPHLILFTRSGTRKGYKLRRMTEAVGFWIDGHVKLVKTAPGAQILVGQMIRLGVSTFDDWADAAADVFAEEVYRPMLVQDGASIDEGGFPYQPGDDVMGRRMTNDDARETYDDQQHLRYGLYEEEWRG